MPPRRIGTGRATWSPPPRTRRRAVPTSTSSVTGTPQRRPTARRRTPAWPSSRPSTTRRTCSGSIRTSSRRAAELALHLRAGHDVVRAVGPAHPRLRPAVVIRREEDERGALAQRGARLGPLGIEAAPDADE